MMVSDVGLFVSAGRRLDCDWRLHGEERRSEDDWRRDGVGRRSEDDWRCDGVGRRLFVVANYGIVLTGGMTLTGGSTVRSAGLMVFVFKCSASLL